MFFNPDYSNAAIDKPRTVGIMAVTADYTMLLSRFTLNVSGFATRTSRESAIYRYWDDIAGAYADMSLTGIDKLYYGAEVAGQWEMSPRFTFNFAASLGRYGRTFYVSMTYGF